MDVLVGVLCGISGVILLGGAITLGKFPMVITSGKNRH